MSCPSHLPHTRILPFPRFRDQGQRALDGDGGGSLVPLFACSRADRRMLTGKLDTTQT